MIKSIFMSFIAIIGAPIYCLCVAFLLGAGKVIGLDYTNMSVYVCEYFQPVFTAAVALLLLIASFRVIAGARKRKSYGKLAALIVFDVIYMLTGIYCIKNQLMGRIATYSGMTNQEIFDYAVKYLRDVWSGYPGGSTRIHILDFDTVSYGYIMANIEVYIFPIAFILLLGLIQWKISKQLKQSEL